MFSNEKPKGIQQTGLPVVAKICRASWFIILSRTTQRASISSSLSFAFALAKNGTHLETTASGCVVIAGASTAWVVNKGAVNTWLTQTYQTSTSKHISIIEFNQKSIRLLPIPRRSASQLLWAGLQVSHWPETRRGARIRIIPNRCLCKWVNLCKRNMLNSCWTNLEVTCCTPKNTCQKWLRSHPILFPAQRHLQYLTSIDLFVSVCGNCMKLWPQNTFIIFTILYISLRASIIPQFSDPRQSLATSIRPHWAHPAVSHSSWPGRPNVWTHGLTNALDSQ